MPAQTFDIYTKRGYAGDLVDSGPRTVQTGVATEGTIEFGVAVKPNRSSDSRGVEEGSPVNVYAVAQREWNHEAATRPSDGTTVYAQDQSVSLLRQGYIYVEVVAACVAGQLLFVDDTSGAFSGTVDDVTAETTNVTAEQDAQAGQVVKARIDIVA